MMSAAIALTGLVLVGLVEGLGGHVAGCSVSVAIHLSASSTFAGLSTSSQDTMVVNRDFSSCNQEVLPDVLVSLR